MSNRLTDGHISILQLLRGMSDNELKQFNLSRDPAKYHYTNQGSQETFSEKNDYKAITTAFKVLSFTTAEVNAIWRIVASILWLGNINFKSKSNNKFLLFSISHLIIIFRRRRRSDCRHRQSTVGQCC